MGVHSKQVENWGGRRGKIIARVGSSLSP